MKVKIFLTLLLVSQCVFINQARADWGAMLEDLKEASKALIPGNEENTSLDIDTVISGLKEALQVGSARAIDGISQTNGYLGNPEIRIPLPPKVEKAGELMRQFGMSGLADEFETSMNRAAEKAAPEATGIVINAIKNMSFEDARSILNGPDDAATQYFKEHTTEQLTQLFKPSIQQSLDNVGSTRHYNQLTEQVAAIPVVGQNIDLNLPNYVTAKALDGLFTMLAVEEKKIRENPAARTTELLKQVFSQ